MKLSLVLVFFFLHLNGTLGDNDERIKALEDIVANLVNKVNELESILAKENVGNAKNVDDALEQRVEKLEQVSKIKNLRTCQELSDRGLTKSGTFDIDPDGDGQGFGPITVYCDFEKNTTSIFHDKEDTIKVRICSFICTIPNANYPKSTLILTHYKFQIEKCSSEGCAVYDFNYFAPLEQIQALIDLSESCTQSIDFGCFMAPLQYEGVSLGYWTDINGDYQNFFHGTATNGHTCRCGIENDCVDSVIDDLKCNCDTKVCFL